MRRRLMGLAGAAVVTTALLAGCTSTSGTSSPSASTGATSAATASTPTVTSISRSSGTLVAGETITVTGRDLTGVTRVAFGALEATAVKVVSATSVTAVVPHSVDFQPASATITVYKGTAAVATAKPLSYTWSAQTGVDREMEYAFQHWTAASYNSSYYDFNAVGGDCQNFVSQSLFAGGLATSTSWYYDSQSSHSESWGYAPTFNDYLADTPSLGFTKLAASQRSQLAIGDLAYFDWNGNGIPDHVMIVSGVSTVNGATKVTLVGHNLDSDYRDLDTAITVDHPGATVWFYKLPATF